MSRISKTFLTVDTVLFHRNQDRVYVLLIQRKKPPFEGHWALPGGFVETNEDIDVAAKRELSEETGITVDQIFQLRAFGKPGRDPRGHMVTIAYFGFVKDRARVQAGDDAAEAQWFDITELPKLAFDHKDIIELAITKL